MGSGIAVPKLKKWASCISTVQLAVRTRHEILYLGQAFADHPDFTVFLLVAGTFRLLASKGPRASA